MFVTNNCLKLESFVTEKKVCQKKNRLELETYVTEEKVCHWSFSRIQFLFGHGKSLSTSKKKFVTRLFFIKSDKHLSPKWQIKKNCGKMSFWIPVIVAGMKNFSRKKFRKKLINGLYIWSQKSHFTPYFIVYEIFGK